jgi:ParB family transcriptional regulator, chromosome partitioning protein
LTDPALLDRLAAERLTREAEAVRTEGWKWVEIQPEADYDALRRFRRIYPEREPIGEEQQAECDRLAERYDALVAEYGDEPPEAVAAELEALDEQIGTLSEGKPCWKPEDIARSGAIVAIGFDGRLSTERGLVRPEDMPKGEEAAPKEARRREEGETVPQRDKGELPDLAVTPEPRLGHASYIASWLEVLKNDKRAIFTAAAHAQRAADYLYSLQANASAGGAA